jgi:hypothetical protein
MITFEKEQDGAWRGAGLHGRVWLITPVRTGWHLSFLDTNRAPVNAGVYGTLEAAKEGAGP